MMRGVGGRRGRTNFIDQIKNFMDKDRRTSIETISAQFDGTLHIII